MQFLKDIREHHLKDFESEAMDEIHRFMEFLEKRFAPPTDAVPGPKPDPVGVETTPMPLIPDNETPSTPDPVVVDPTPVDTAVPVADTEDEPVEETVSTVEPTVEVLTTAESSVIATVAPEAFTCQPVGK